MGSIPVADARAKSAAATRQAMLDAARRRFMQESYENVGLRDIAGDVGVDVALVSRYFGSKEDLFREVLGPGEKEDLIPTGLSDREMAAYLADMFVNRGGEEGKEHVEHLLIILRSASSPTASRLVRDALGVVLCPLSGALSGDNREMRAGMCMGVWMGMTIVQTIMSLEPLCQVACDELEPRLRKLFEAALASDA